MKGGESTRPLIVPAGNPSIWSRMGIRAAYGLSLLELRKSNPRVFAMSADLGRSSGLGRFSDEFPESFLNVGIAEQLMISVAAGIARSGRAVFASTFAPFATLRAGEFMRMEIGYMQSPVAVVGLGSGLSLGYLGNSHYGLEDVGVVRSMAGLAVYSPADASEMIALLNKLADKPEPCYVRLTGGLQSPHFFSSPQESGAADFTFLGKAGKELIVSTGAVSGEVARALKILGLDANQESNFGFLHVHKIKPLNQEVINHVRAASKVIVFDEHLAFGGLSSALLDGSAGAGEHLPPIQSVNLGASFPEQQSHDRGLDLAGLSSQAISKVLADFLKK